MSAPGEGAPGSRNPIPLSAVQGLSAADAGATSRPRPPLRPGFSWPLPTPVCNQTPTTQKVRLSACFSPKALWEALCTWDWRRKEFVLKQRSTPGAACRPDLDPLPADRGSDTYQHLLCASRTLPAFAHLCSREVSGAFIYFYYFLNSIFKFYFSFPHLRIFFL